MTSIRVALLVGDDLRSGGAELIDVWEKERSAKLWVDIEDPDAATLEPLLDKFEECVDALQDAIFLDARPSHLDELLHLKRDANVLRRQSFPQRELLNQISRGDAQFVQKTHLIYYRDVYDHMFRISETID